jgi:hypothetical protein
VQVCSSSTSTSSSSSTSSSTHHTWIVQDDQEEKMAYIDLAQNPHGYTGYRYVVAVVVVAVAVLTIRGTLVTEARTPVRSILYVH